MKQPIVKILSITLLIMFLGYCSSPIIDTEPIMISGTVLNQTDNSPIHNAIVRIISPPPEQVEQTDSLGVFLFELEIDSTMDLILTINKEGFIADTLNALAIPERDVNLSTTYLVLESAASDTTNDPITGTAGPSNLRLVSVSSSVITVIGSGGTDNATITFQVQDSTGKPVGSDIEVSFSVGSNPNGGEYVSPASAGTDENGQVSVNLVSGTISGVVQIIASISLSGSTIQSQAVPITIHGGLPDQAHFGLASLPINIAGWDQWGLTASVTAFVGDKYGNFCTPGTAVYFTTDGGMIEGSGLTNEGRCSVTLVASPPKPEHPTLGKGFATVIGRTANENNESIVDTFVVLFSGPPVISNLSTSVLNVPDGGEQTITFTVADVNGNPLTQGTSITASLKGDNVEVVGDVSTTLFDTQAIGPGITTFSVTILDSKPDDNLESSLQLEIATLGSNGETKIFLTGSGY